MNKVAEIQSQAELPQWLEPLAQRIADSMRDELRANTQELEKIRHHLDCLVEAQVIFLETIRRQSGK
jgi:hypothetical protein